LSGTDLSPGCEEKPSNAEDPEYANGLMHGHAFLLLSSGVARRYVSEGPIEMLTACLLVGICMDRFGAKKKAPHIDTLLLCDGVSE
jgi:hypothetical protein